MKATGACQSNHRRSFQQMQESESQANAINPSKEQIIPTEAGMLIDMKSVNLSSWN
jgi:hypothetical protein